MAYKLHLKEVCTNDILNRKRVRKMKNGYGKVALVVGASSGVGKCCAEYLSDQGYTVYGTSRNAPFPEESSHQDESKTLMMPLDVTKEETIKKAVDYIVEKEGRIDLLLNCAGYSLSGAVEDISLAEAQAVFNTNVFGIMMVCRKVLPFMRKQRSGLIVNISSVAGLISVPYQSMYSASKYALEAVTEALRIETKPFGINVSLIEPGDMKTNFKRTYAKDAAHSPYQERLKAAINAMIKSEQSGPGPEVVLKELKKILNSKNPPVRLIVGFEYKLINLLKRLLPSQSLEGIVSKIYS